MVAVLCKGSKVRFNLLPFTMGSVLPGHFSYAVRVTSLALTKLRTTPSGTLTQDRVEEI